MPAICAVSSADTLSVKVGVMLLQTQCLIAFAFGFVEIEVQHAVAAPCVGIGQQVLQQAAGVAVACQQQFGLLGVVRRDFGVEQPLAVAAAALRRFARFQNGNAHAVFRQLARGCGAGYARAVTSACSGGVVA